MKKLALITVILAFAANTFAAGAGIACSGRINKTNSTYEIQYFITDHLGSTRVVVSQSGTVLGTNDYYPFGKRWESANLQAPNTRYLFSGKERQTTGGINYMDFGSRMYDDFLGRWFTHDPQSYRRPWETPYGYCGGNPVIRIDPDGQVWWLVPVIVGAAVGAYSGGVIANGGQMNPFKWNYNSHTFGYMLGGAVVGGISGLAGGYIATSGIPFANTLGIVNSSIINSIGTNLYTGGKTPVSISFGIFSFDITNGRVGYLGKKGNSFLENLGYGFGALANATDLVSFIRGGGQNVKVNSASTKGENEWWGHSSITDENGNSLVSVGLPFEEGVEKTGSLSQTFKNSIKDANMKWPNYAGDSGTWSVEMNNVSINALSKYASGVTRWDLLLNSCVGHTSRALWAAGIPNIYLFHPHMLNLQLLIRQIGIYSSPYFYQIP